MVVSRKRKSPQQATVPKHTNDVQVGVSVFRALEKMQSLSDDTLQYVEKLRHSSSEREKNSLVRKLEVKMKMSQEAIDETKARLTSLAPSGTAYVHKRLKTESSRTATAATILGEKTKTKKLPVRTVKSAKKVSRKGKKVVVVHSPDTFPVPPDDRAQFTAVEAMSALDKCEKKRISVNQVISHWIEQKYVPVKAKSTVYQKYQSWKAKPWKLKEWGVTGRPPIVSMSEFVADMRAKVAKNNGRAITQENVHDYLFERRTADGILDNAARGSQPDRQSSKTDENYYLLLGMDKNAAARSNAILKTRRRVIAETSIRNAISFVFVEAFSSFIIGNPSDYNIPPVENATEGAQLMERLLRGYWKGLPVMPVRPALRINIDAQTTYAYAGVSSCGKKRYWRLQLGMDDSGTRADYVETGNDGLHLNGLGVQIVHGSTVAGTVLPTTVYVKNLTERELPGDSGLFEVEIPGFCHGGGTDPRTQSVGRVVFLRSKDPSNSGLSPEQRSFRDIIREKVLLPFIETTRGQLFKGYDPADVPDWLSASVSCDGDAAQMKITTSETCLDEDAKRKIAMYKFAAGSTGTQQPQDLQPTHKAINAKLKTVTSLHGPETPFKTGVTEAFKRIQSDGYVVLRSQKIQALIDFIVTLTEDILPTIVSPTTVRKGGLENGSIDKNTHTWPDMLRMMDTCRRVRSQEEEDCVVNEFAEFMDDVVQHGMVREVTMEKFGVAVDTDSTGMPVPRVASITNESHQRAKVLSHEYVREERKRQYGVRREKELVKCRSEIKRAEDIMESNMKAERQLFTLLEIPLTSGRRMIANAQKQHFAKLSRELLKCFIHVREFEGVKIPRERQYRWPIKMNLEAAERNEDCLISRAFELRWKRTLLFQVPTEEDLVPPLMDVVENTTSGHPTFRMGQEIADTQPLPSQFLANCEWLKKVRRDVRGVDFAETVCSTMKSKADTLFVMLKKRLVVHLFARVPKREKHDHYSMNWFRENLSRMCAILVLAGHVKDDLESKTSSKNCLLSSPSTFFKALADVESLEGCYLYYMAQDRKWVRSGKVVGTARTTRKIRERNQEHFNNSLQKTLSSQFYQLYPHKDSVDKSDMVRRGHFQDLMLYGGLCFERGETASLCSTTNGIFQWSHSNLEKIGGINFPGCVALVEKQLHMIGYLFELTYDLMLSTDNNVSQSPGFETPLGIFGNSPSAS